MTNEREDAEFRRILASLDEDPPEMPPYADQLWVALQHTLLRSSSKTPGEDSPLLNPSEDSTLETPIEDAVVVELDGFTSSRRVFSPRRLRVTALAAGAAAAVAVALFALSDRSPEPIETVDGPASITTSTPTPTSTVAVPVDPAAACAEYFAHEWSIDRILATDLATVDFDAALDAIDRLRVDLEASGEFTAGDLTQLAIARGSMLQAKLEVAEGLLDRAEVSLRGIDDQIALYNDVGDEARCAPADE